MARAEAGLAMLGLCALVAGACRRLPPEPDLAERRALTVRVGPDAEARARALEAAGDLGEAVRWRRAIALARPGDARARRELVRVALIAGAGDERDPGVRRAGLDAIDAAFLARDRASASEDLARLYSAAGLPRRGIPWARRAIGYGGPLRPARIVLLARLAAEVGDQPGISAAAAALSADQAAEVGDHLVQALAAQPAGRTWLLARADGAAALAPPGSLARARLRWLAGDRAASESIARQRWQAGDARAGLLLAAITDAPEILSALAERSEAPELASEAVFALAERSPSGDLDNRLRRLLDDARGTVRARAALLLAAGSERAGDRAAALRLYARAATEPYGEQESARARRELARLRATAR